MIYFFLFNKNLKNFNNFFIFFLMVKFLLFLIFLNLFFCSKISVIIPIYNNQILWKKKIDCILDQTLKDIEIIIIIDDEFQTNKEENFIENYSKKYSQIKVIHLNDFSNLNKIAIENSKGEFISFFYLPFPICKELFEISYYFKKQEKKFECSNVFQENEECKNYLNFNYNDNNNNNNNNNNLNCNSCFANDFIQNFFIKDFIENYIIKNCAFNSNKKDINPFDPNKKYLVTGGAGFIGYFLSKSLLEKGAEIIGFDNLNNYYNVSLKQSRLKELLKYPKYKFIKGDLSNESDVNEVFKSEKPEIIINLGAQAGVRYSITNPKEYINSNLLGFFNILEACRHNKIEHLIFASSSSVYGGNTKIPFSVSDMVNKPESLYAATKASNELMAYSYCKLYGIKATGLRFFTVYGPFGRPDMAYFKFALKMVKNEAIPVFNNGDMLRDFTYIDDIVDGIVKTLNNPPKKNERGVYFKVYNIGNNKPVKLMDFIYTLEKCLGIEAKKEFLPMQQGDVYQTYADVDDLINDFGFKPKTTIQEGLCKFTEWFKKYYNLNI